VIGLTTDKQSESLKRLAYSVKEVAHAAGVSEGTIYRLIYRKELGTVRIGDRQLIPNDELHRLTGTDAA